MNQSIIGCGWIFMEEHILGHVNQRCSNKGFTILTKLIRIRQEQILRILIGADNENTIGKIKQIIEELKNPVYWLQSVD